MVTTFCSCGTDATERAETWVRDNMHRIVQNVQLATFGSVEAKRDLFSLWGSMRKEADTFGFNLMEMLKKKMEEMKVGESKHMARYLATIDELN